MTPSASAGGPSGRHEYRFTDDDFEAIARYASRHFGINLPSTKRQLVYSRLVRRIRALGLPDFKSYVALLDKPEAQDEHPEILAALATNTTHFFRERHHFDLLEETVLPPLLAAARNGRRVRLWSSASSTGQEPFSLAMTVLRLMPEASRYDIRILATDIVPAIVDRAKSARFSDEELSSLSADQRSRFLQPSPDEPGLSVMVPEVRALVSFGVLNLIEPLPMKGPFDVIFCRNVAIYFDRPTQQAVWQALASVLHPEGHLFIGHSERITGPVEQSFRSCGITTYQHRPNRDAGLSETRKRSA